MFERFTDRARRVVVIAQEEARGLGHSYIGTEHLVLGLVAEGEGVGAKALEGLGIELSRIRQEVERTIGKSTAAVPEGHIPFTPRAKKVLEHSLREALALGHNYIGTEHVLLGVVREGEGVGAQVLVKLGASLDTVRAKVIQLLQGFGSVPPTMQERTDARRDRLSPGLRHALDAAEALASGSASVGTHHLLSVFVDWEDLAANAVLRAGGFDAAKVGRPIAEWDVASTRDETPAEWGSRVTEVTTAEESVIVRVADAALADKVRALLEGGGAVDLQALFGQAIRDAAPGSAAPTPPAEADEPDAGEAET